MLEAPSFNFFDVKKNAAKTLIEIPAEIPVTIIKTCEKGMWIFPDMIGSVESKIPIFQKLLLLNIIFGKIQFLLQR